MKLTGYLSEFPLPEIFRFVEQGSKTGLLSIQSESDASQQHSKVHHIWLNEGRIVAVADQLDNKRLLSMLKQRGWINPPVLSLVREWSEAEQPLGLYLKAQGTITEEQLQVLFHAQVIQPVCSLFKVQDAEFVFDTKATLPKTEMTGLSLLATVASLLGLRVLRDWKALAEKLPNTNSGLTKATVGKPNFQLDPQERQVWEAADGSVSIAAIAKQLQLPVETIQQIAFRLGAVGLVEEVPILALDTISPSEEKTSEVAAATNGTGTNHSFMQNLVGILNTKIV